jgi:hypothetical protein
MRAGPRKLKELKQRRHMVWGGARVISDQPNCNPLFAWQGLLSMALLAQPKHRFHKAFLKARELERH